MLSAQKLAIVALSLASTAYAGCLADLQAIDSAVTALDAKVKALTGGSSCSSQFNAIVTANTNLKSKLDTATSNANAVSSISQSDAQSCYDYLCVNTLWSDTNTLITDVINKYSVAKGCGLTSSAKTLLTDDKTKVDSLADAYIAKAPTSTLKTNGQSCKTKYDNLLNSAITKYSS